MTKEEKIYKVINELENEEAVNIYFDWNNDLIEKLNLSDNDPRFIINARYDTRKRFSTNINSRLVWGLGIADNELTVMMMLLEKDLDHIDDFMRLEIFQGKSEQAFLVFKTFEQFKTQSVKIKNLWLNCCKDYLQAEKGSRFKHSHIPLLYDASVDNEIRNEVIEKSKSSEFKKTIMGKRKEKISKNEEATLPLNLILYGPPGTGKTYELRNKYFQRFTDKSAKQTKEDFNLQLVKDFAWWEVISLAMLDLKNAKVNNIANHPLLKAKNSISNNKNYKATIWGNLQRHTMNECENVNVTKKDEPLYFIKNKKSEWSIDEKVAKSEYPELFTVLKKYNEFTPKTIEEKRYVFTTFHQSYSYEDFIEGIKPVLNNDEESDNLKYEIVPGIFKEIAKRAENNPDKEYAIFIDEINRGNIANIFGELITLIEEDKRKGADEELEAVLPYSKEKFSVPKNLFIIGTMNTADRSVEALDTALRRRFSFKEIPPNYDLPEINKEIEGINLSEMLRKINQRIAQLLSKDQLIGHSYFMRVNDLTDLKTVFQNNIIPLLQEYFYGDTGKIGLVLGQGFFENNENEKRDPDNIFAEFSDSEDYSELLMKKVFNISNIHEMEIDRCLKALSLLIK